ncbi:MAG TPA: transposase [Bryobacteraceae bacterium]|nr:transposase [Bryobacteraceae bacterium]
MDPLAFSYDRSFVLDALRHGDIDYLENVSEAAEADLFRHLIRRQVVQRLADTYPSPRKKEEVPVWIYLASELSLKLHGAQSYHAFPRILRSGGLIEALGPEMGGRKTRHPETGDVTLACPGFNAKNDYDRQSPCDQDFLRKFAHDTQADLLHAWFNREVPRLLRSLGLFDPEGLFIGDASYLFVPDNDHYQQSDLLWFDEHNHPVDPNQVDLSDKRYQQHRCYKLVSLLHVNRKLDSFFVVAARVVPGRRHECPILYELVEEVVRAVHKGFIKVLIVDRGLIDGERMGYLKQKLAIDTIVPLRTNMDLYADAIGLTRLRGFTWEPYIPQAAPPPAVCASPTPARVEKREAKRQRTLAERKAQAAAVVAAGPVPVPVIQPQTLLGLGRGLRSWSQCPVPLTAVVNREHNEQGHTQDWVLVTTSPHFTAAQIRSTYELRPAIEERHRQYKGFWDLTRMHSCAFSLVLNQALFVLLAYTLVQAHLVLRQRQQLNPGVWERTRQLLSPSLEVVAVYYRQRFCLLTLAEFGRILLEIEEPARGNLREKLRRIDREQYSLLGNARPP